MNDQVIAIVQIVLSVILVSLILLQVKGSGLGSTFGGEMAFYRTKRGAERILFYLTIIFSVLFLAATIIGLIV